MDGAGRGGNQAAFAQRNAGAGLRASASAAAAGAVGRGEAWGAVSILNATATGVGAALAVRAGANASWSWGGGSLRCEGAPDDLLARAVARGDPRGARVACTTALPPSRGLKTSASAATAMLRAAAQAQGHALEDRDLLREAVAATRAAHVTLTGALDDQAAVTLGGCHLTDNRRDRLLQALPTRPWHVAVWIPAHAIPKAAVRGIDATAIAREARAAEALAARGDLAQAMTRNGAAFHRLYAAAGLPVDARPAEVALAHGALGAGLSGTGPAVAALFDAPARLPDVPGGAWHWTTAVEAP